MFITEYQWEVLDRDPLAKAITVLDIASVSISSLVGDTLEVVKQTITWANQHYPERSDVILMVNAPFWVSLLWQIVKPWVHENTQKKVRILSKKETLNVSIVELWQYSYYYISYCIYQYIYIYICTSVCLYCV